MFFWHRLGIPIFLILWPTWIQLAFQLGPKIQQNSAQEGSKFQANLHDVLDALFHRLWKLPGSIFGSFGWQFGCQVDWRIYTWRARGKSWFFGFRRSETQKIKDPRVGKSWTSMQHRLKNRYKIEHPLSVNFSWILEPTWWKKHKKTEKTCWKREAKFLSPKFPQGGRKERRRKEKEWSCNARFSSRPRL